MSVAQKTRSQACSQCQGTGWRQYDENHTKICEFCCLHEQGWWKLTKSFANWEKGKDNRCCKYGCGTMLRDLPKRIRENQK